MMKKITVIGSQGKRHQVLVPPSYLGHVPLRWKWSGRKYHIAGLLASKVPVSHIAATGTPGIRSRTTVYGWLHHPEFADYVDDLAKELYWHRKVARIKLLKVITESLVKKLMDGLDDIEISNRTLKLMVQGILRLAQLIREEKGE